MAEIKIKKNVTYKNVTWKTREEKEIFFRKYFKNSDFVEEVIQNRLYNYKTNILKFIDSEKDFKKKHKKEMQPIDIRKFIDER